MKVTELYIGLGNAVQWPMQAFKIGDNELRKPRMRWRRDGSLCVRISRTSSSAFLGDSEYLNAASSCHLTLTKIVWIKVHNLR